MKIAVVTDSASDIPEEQAQALNIRVIPCIIVIGDRDFEDGKGLSREDFYESFPDMDPPPTTAAPSIGMFEETYQDALDSGYDGVISIHPPDTLSGIINAASAAALRFNGNVQVYDSRLASMGLGYQVLEAANIVREETDFGALTAALNKFRSQVRVYAMLDTLSYLRRSGRVSWVQAGIGSLLSIRTFIELSDGEVIRLDQIRTRKKGIAHLSEMIEALPPLDQLAILHSGAEEDAARLAHSISDSVGINPLSINITTIIGTHVGPKGLGCAAVLK